MLAQYLVEDDSYFNPNTNEGPELVKLRRLLAIERKTGALNSYEIVTVIYDNSLSMCVKLVFDFIDFISLIVRNIQIVVAVALRWFHFEHKAHGGQWYMIALRQGSTEHQPYMFKCFYFTTPRFWLLKTLSRSVRVTEGKQRSSRFFYTMTENLLLRSVRKRLDGSAGSEQRKEVARWAGYCI